MTRHDETMTALEAAKARIRARTAEARRAADDAGKAADAVRTVTRTASSARGEVAVTAQTGGAVRDVVIAPGALTLAPPALSALVTDTIARAQRAADRAAVEEIAAVVGEDSPLVARLTAQLDAGDDPSTADR